ncbi:MerR family transcriptional regulator [Streptomyces avermitilis]|uniref:MerR family transcriptional regulator n=1 Tax=Streptomyces avermitilis TaxID=33903 RepID=UPI0033E6B950
MPPRAQSAPRARWTAVSVAAARAVCVPHRDGHPTGPPRGASPRQVRFYEAKSLITSTREPNNYRDYSEAALGRVQQIRELLNAVLASRFHEVGCPRLDQISGECS